MTLMDFEIRSKVKFTMTIKIFVKSITLEGIRLNSVPWPVDDPFEYVIIRSKLEFTVIKMLSKCRWDISALRTHF